MGGGSAAFGNVSRDPSPTGHVVHIGWDFGDGATWSGSPGARDVSHAYGTPGMYTVSLFVIDDDGGLSMLEKRISISE